MIQAYMYVCCMCMWSWKKEDSFAHLFLACDCDEDEDVADEPSDVSHGVHEDRHQELWLVKNECINIKYKLKEGEKLTLAQNLSLRFW